MQLFSIISVSEVPKGVKSSIDVPSDFLVFFFSDVNFFDLVIKNIYVPVVV